MRSTECSLDSCTRCSIITGSASFHRLIGLYVISRPNFHPESSLQSPGQSLSRLKRLIKKIELNRTTDILR